MRHITRAHGAVAAARGGVGRAPGARAEGRVGAASINERYHDTILMAQAAVVALSIPYTQVMEFNGYFD